MIIHSITMVLLLFREQDGRQAKNSMVTYIGKYMTLGVKTSTSSRIFIFVIYSNAFAVVVNTSFYHKSESINIVKNYFRLFMFCSKSITY